MMPYFHRILQEFDKQNTEENLVLNENEFKLLLKSLDFKEKNLLRKIVKTISWNVGSLHLLKILQDNNIMSASEYLLMQGNSEDDFQHVQGVLSDMLESKSDLFANVICNCAYSKHASLKNMYLNKSKNVLTDSSNTKLIFYLEESIQRLLKDFEGNENIIANDYLINLITCLEEETMVYFVNLHINNLLELNNISGSKAFGLIDTWKCSISKNSNFFYILNELVKFDVKRITNRILQTSLYPNFRHWKYLVIILDLVAINADADVATTIKRHLRQTFKSAITKGSLNLLFSLLIVARTVCSDNQSSVFDSYCEFYKNTISDLRYIAVNKLDFINVIQLLTTIIQAETCTKYLEVHAKVSISPLAHCNEIILKYKKICREKINMLSSSSTHEKLNLEVSNIINLDDGEEDLFNSQELDMVE